MLPWLSRISVRKDPAPRLRHRSSGRYQRISPLHRPFQMPLPSSRPAVSTALLQLSWRLSPQTGWPAYAPFKPSDSEQRLHGSSYRGCWHELSPSFLCGLLNTRGEPLVICSPLTAVYNPKAFIPHAASLRQACAHCGRFSTAATRRCLGSISVPVSGGMLSHPVPVLALVRLYHTN